MEAVKGLMSFESKLGMRPTKTAEPFLCDVPEEGRKKTDGWNRIRFLCTSQQSKQITGLGEGGDDHISWNRRYVDSVRWARQKFYDMLDQGWIAFEVKEDGTAGEKITEFDPDLEDVLVTDRDILMTAPIVPG